MKWLSILPEQYSYVESAITKFFLVAVAIVLGPWLGLLAYDLIIYVLRTAMYEMPYIGGRASNRPRPRAPTLTTDADGQPRGIAVVATAAVDDTKELAAEGAESIQKLREGLNQRRVAANIMDQE